MKLETEQMAAIADARQGSHRRDQLRIAQGMNRGEVDRRTEPDVVGWYRTRSGNDWLLFSLSESASGLAWHAHVLNGDVTPCDWEYIDQAGPVDLVSAWPRPIHPGMWVSESSRGYDRRKWHRPLVGILGAAAGVLFIAAAWAAVS